MTFESDALDALQDRLDATEARVLTSPRSVRMAPYGQVRALWAQAPDGVRMEFFEQ
jgi:hypothetical protein